MNRTRQVWRILAAYILLAPWMASSVTAQAIFPPNGLTAFPAVDADLTLRASVSGGYDVNSRTAPTTSPEIAPVICGLTSKATFRVGAHGTGGR